MGNRQIINFFASKLVFEEIVICLWIIFKLSQRIETFLSEKGVSTLNEKIENKYQKSRPMSTPFRSKTVYIIKNETHQTINLVLAHNPQSKEGRIIQQTGATPQAKIFEPQQKTTIAAGQVLMQLEIRCQQEQGRILISLQDYRAILQKIENIRQQEHQEDSENDQSGSDQQDNSRPQAIPSYKQESSNNHEHRGRGRPKGSKNKKTIIKEAQLLKEPPAIELKTAMNGLMKRGKGRPKGSKNKVKDYSHPLKHQQGTSLLPYGKRGKGRPKGSKNKIKLPNQIMADEDIQNLSHKRRGRPLGAKNRPNSVESVSGDHEQSEQFLKTEIERPSASEVEEYFCCSGCEQNIVRRKILSDQISIEENLHLLRSVAQDLGLQNKANLITTACQYGDEESLEQLLSVSQHQYHPYRSPWQVEKLIDRGRFEIRTKKQGLSKTGKEGNTVLLHDSYRRKERWWKEITVERIIQSLPREPIKCQKVLQKLFAASPQLRKQIFSNLASVIRCGNFEASSLLLRQALSSPSLAQLGFSHEHFDLLDGNMTLINHLKKYGLLQRNQGTNYCSPIHAAAICNNPEFVRKLLQIFTDVLNAQDSLHRKPVHYASLASSSDNLSILVESGANLREYDKRKMTPLMLACSQGLFYNVQFILEKVRDPNYINFKSEEGYTALHYAILRSHLECIELLLSDPYVDLWALTKDKGDIFHLLGGTGNTQILQLVLQKQILPYMSFDKFKKTPPMIAVRNNNNDCLVRLIENGCKLDKQDSSQNSLLHYAAAYGNLQAILMLKDRVEQTKNKRGLYPWEVAVYKGHMGAASLLQLQDSVEFNQDPLYFTLTTIRGTKQYMDCVRYIADKMMKDIYYEEKSSGNGYLHLVCQLSQEQYIRSRQDETCLPLEIIKEEYSWIQQELISFFVEKGLDGYRQNYGGQTPLRLCIENNNLIGVQKLLTGKISFEPEPSSASNILHCLGSLACKGHQEIKFVQKKLRQCSTNELKTHLRKIDHNGFDFLLYFLKSFTESAQNTFRKNVIKKIATKLQNRKQGKSKTGNIQLDSEKQCFDQFVKFEDRLISLVDFLLDLGCDVNALVIDKKNETSELYRKWGVAHFLMRFPSLKLVKYFKSKVRDFNSPNAQQMTPLHLFCKNVSKGNLLDANISLPDDYNSLKVLEYLLSQAALNPNCFDSFRALPILYAALNGQYDFISTLRRFKSEVNFCTTRNEVPFIELIKRNKSFTGQQMQSLLNMGFDPNFLDMDKRNSLHHLAFHANNVDSNPQLCRTLIEFGAKINALDKYERSPIFYCFCEMEGEQRSLEPLQKLQIVQVLISHKDINLNLLDVYRRTILHYACEKNHFFSIVYLLDKNINIEAKDYEENTPLALSLLTRNLDQAALIISKGVKYGFVEEAGEKQSYFSYAYRKLSAGICFLLLDNGYPIQRALEEIPNSCFKESLIQKYIRK